MSTTRKQMVEWAISKIGTKEGSAEHKALLNLYNSQNPLPRGVKADGNTPWCAIFASCAALANNAVDIVPTEMSVGRMIEKAQQMGCWQERDDYEPEPADFIVYDWQDTTGSTKDNTGWPDHIGMIEKVTAKTMTVIEGNYSNQVKRRTIKVNAPNIRGFITPRYEATEAHVTAPENKPTNEPQKNLEAVVRDVRAGKYGNEPERSKKLRAAGYNPEEVQAAVNAQIAAEKNQKAPADQKPASNEYVVVTEKSGLNIRSTPNGAIIGSLIKGEIVKIASINNGWAKLDGRIGYVSAQFLKKK